MFQRRFDGALMLLLNLCLAYWSRQRWALTNRIFRFSVLLFVALSAKDGFRVVNLIFYVLAAVAFSSALVVVVSTAMWLLYAWAEGAEKVDSQSERVDPGVWEKILDRYVIAETRKKSLCGKMIDSSHGGVGRERRSQRGGSRITSMTIDEFLLIERAVRVSRPGLFRLAKPDPCASDVELAHVEQELGCKLPESYRQFLLRCGGGDYPLTSMFSAYRGGSWYIVKKRRELDALLPTALLPMHDDNAGGLFVLKIEDGCALEPVYYYDWESKELSGARHANILEFVAMNFD